MKEKWLPLLLGTKETPTLGPQFCFILCVPIQLQKIHLLVSFAWATHTQEKKPRWFANGYRAGFTNILAEWSKRKQDKNMKPEHITLFKHTRWHAKRIFNWERQKWKPQGPLSSHPSHHTHEASISVLICAQSLKPARLLLPHGLHRQIPVVPQKGSLTNLKTFVSLSSK